MRRNGQDQPVSDINITPLTDVMLVLLVIFMISSPVLLARGIEVHLPQVKEAPALVESDHVLYISKDGELILDNVTCTPDALALAFVDLVKAADVSGDVVNLFIRADETVTYRDMTAVMDIATRAGIERISLVQEIVESPPEDTAGTSDEQPENTPSDG